jgi:carbonic anhydrase/acetyltransferase-like protein (isoleucine patch superfamily)
MKKYELEYETFGIGKIKLHRIKALKDFGDVKAGDLGGCIQNEKNLSQNGDCWVYYNARVYGNAEVYDNARVSDNAEVYGDAIVYGNARVSGNARVYDNAGVYGNAKVYHNAVVYHNAKVFGIAEVYGNCWVYGNTKVYGNARVYDNAIVYGDAKVFGNAVVYHNAKVFGNAVVTKKVITFGNAFDYNITITDNHIEIGCQHHTKEEWYNFTNKDIIKMDGKKAFHFWIMFKPLLKQLGHLQDDKEIKIAELKAELAELEAENE